MKSYKEKTVCKSLLVAVVSLMVVFASCTDLANTSYDEIITQNFEPSEDDVGALVGQAYVPWRQLLLGWNGLWRAQEISADQLVIPARPNGWVDGGVYRQFHEHRWTADHQIVGTVWSRAYGGAGGRPRPRPAGSYWWRPPAGRPP
jgi:starch-binding outer membrane protein, SusD/RagB family